MSTLRNFVPYTLLMSEAWISLQQMLEVVLVVFVCALFNKMVRNCAQSRIALLLCLETELVCELLELASDLHIHRDRLALVASESRRFVFGLFGFGEAGARGEEVAVGMIAVHRAAQH